MLSRFERSVFMSKSSLNLIPTQADITAAATMSQDDLLNDRHAYKNLGLDIAAGFYWNVRKNKPGMEDNPEYPLNKAHDEAKRLARLAYTSTAEDLFPIKRRLYELKKLLHETCPHEYGLHFSTPPVSAAS